MRPAFANWLYSYLYLWIWAHCSVFTIDFLLRDSMRVLLSMLHSIAEFKKYSLFIIRQFQLYVITHMQDAQNNNNNFYFSRVNSSTKSAQLLLQQKFKKSNFGAQPLYSRSLHRYDSLQPFVVFFDKNISMFDVIHRIACFVGR